MAISVARAVFLCPQQATLSAGTKWVDQLLSYAVAINAQVPAQVMKMLALFCLLTGRSTALTTALSPSSIVTNITPQKNMASVTDYK